MVTRFKGLIAALLVCGLLLSAGCSSTPQTRRCKIQAVYPQDHGVLVAAEDSDTGFLFSFRICYSPAPIPNAGEEWIVEKSGSYYTPKEKVKDAAH